MSTSATQTATVTTPMEETFQQLIRTVQERRRDHHGPTEIRDLVFAVAGEMNLDSQTASMCADLYEKSHYPRLMVDWGQDLRIGKAVRPFFHLVCPPGYRFQPQIEVEVDRDLDHDADNPARRPRQEADGHWIFNVPFSLTTNSAHCNPGQYIFNLSVKFRHVARPWPNRFFCYLRLNVEDAQNAAGPCLEIEGDGKSILNLHGQNLKDFATVRLKATEDSIVNIQDLASALSPQTTVEETGGETAQVDNFQHEYELKIDRGGGDPGPWVSRAIIGGTRRTEAALTVETGDHYLIRAQLRARFGRNRTNDFVIRALPRNTQQEKDLHDPCSHSISGSHMKIELNEDGLQLIDDRSTNGTELEGELLHCDPKHSEVSRKLFKSGDAHESMPLQLAVIPRNGVTHPFDLRVRLYSGAEAFDDGYTVECPSKDYCTLLKVAAVKRWRNAERTGIDAVRFRRAYNVPQERYIVLFSQAMIGSSEDAPICIDHPSVDSRHARLIHLDGRFWLEHLARNNVTVVSTKTVQGHQLGLRELVPLTYGTTIRIGEVSMRFDKFEQLHLGEPGDTRYPNKV